MVRRAGFSAVELWAARPHWDYSDPGQIEAVGETCRRLGLRVLSIHGPFYRHVSEARQGRWLTLYDEDPRVRQEALGELREAVLAASRLGASFLVVHWEEWGRGLEELVSLIDTARQERVKLALENSHHRPEASVPVLLEVVDRLGAEEAVGLCFDTGHAHVAEESLRGALEACASRILLFHLHDNDGLEDAHRVPFRGTIDWLAFAKDLEELGLGGYPMSLELRRRGPYMDDLLAARQAMERMFGGLR
jgi:sugar phosphate isomerase/epimerase